MKTTKKLNDVIPNWLLGEGIFSALNGFAVPWQYEGIASELDLEYHGNISGEKNISPLVNKIMEGDTLTSDELGKLASVIYTMNHVRWEKEFETMFYDYNPIENYSMTETMSNDITEIDYGRQHTRTDNLTHKKTGSDVNTKNLSHKKTGSDINSKNLTDKNTPNTTNTDAATVSGFNSSVGVPDRGNTSTMTGTDTTTHTGTDTVTYNTVDNDTGTDSVTYNTTDKDSGTVTDNDTGTDTHTRNYTLTRTGNIGTLTSQQMIESQRNLFMWKFFYDVVFPDVDKVLTLSIY